MRQRCRAALWSAVAIGLLAAPGCESTLHRGADRDAGARDGAFDGPGDQGVDGAPVPDRGAGSEAALGDSGAAPLADTGQPPPVDRGTPPADSGTVTPPPKAGNPAGNCPVPAEGQAADTSTPTTVVGQGNAASCTHAALAAAVAQGGVITFSCGAAPVTIPVTATLQLPVDRDTVIDGGGLVTLDGGGAVRILEWNSPTWMTNDYSLTLQHLNLVNGKATGTDAIPVRPEPCSQGFNDGEGGAVYVRDGKLRAIDVTFANNQAAELGPDTGGGAVYLFGCKPAYIVSCTFANNHASNAGGLGTLFAEQSIYNSLFENNSAVGHGANNDDPSQCSYINNGQHQVGSGGNGGAIYSDGVGVSITICGTKIANNTANEFGAAIFFTSNDASNKGTLTIEDSTLSHNVGNGVWEAAPGISTNADFPPPINSTITK